MAVAKQYSLGTTRIVSRCRLTLHTNSYTIERLVIDGGGQALSLVTAMIVSDNVL